MELSPDSSEIYLSDLSPSDKPWDTHRANAEIVQSLYHTAGYQRYAERIHQCSRLLGFALEAKDATELKLRLFQASFCRVRFCPVCQSRRSLMWRARFFTALPKLMEDYPKYRYLFLTLTVKNCPIGELRATVGEMNKAWQRMSKLKIFPATGYIRSTEVTRGKDGTAHPHFHALLLVPSSYFGKNYLNQDKWTELWQNSARLNYTPIVDVRAVKPYSNQTTEDAIKLALIETLKYTVKDNDLVNDSAWLAELTKQLHKTRAIALGGVFKKYIKEEEPENLITESEEELNKEADTQLWFGWREMVKRYIKVIPQAIE